MIYNIFVWKPFLFQLQQRIKHWAKPATLSLISGVLSDLTRSRADLIFEKCAVTLTVDHPPSTSKGAPANHS
jgi:hypothetical protein